ncbi:MAG TPA: YkgJ family cysteine cluster protein [Armatimonadota bacterium]|nr:YkgJ family cysteine cluster protein [Armatimonadota bacterium]
MSLHGASRSIETGQHLAGGACEDGGNENPSLSPVVRASCEQQEAERYSESLPMRLCDGCDGCGLRCTEGVRMTRSEYQRIETHLRSNPDEAARVAAQEKSIPGWPVTKFCQFRDTEKNRCSIYPVRPVICRLFGHTEWLPCPLEIVPLKGQDAMDVYQRYAREEIRPFDEWRQRPLVLDESRAEI